MDTESNKPQKAVQPQHRKTHKPRRRQPEQPYQQPPNYQNPGHGHPGHDHGHGQVRVEEPEQLTHPMRERWLSIAEIIDAWRLVPRAILGMYGLLVYNLYTWYISIDTIVKTTCDATLLKILVDAGTSIADAQLLACQISDMVGGPTTAQTAFVTTVIGLSTPLFAFYANTGRTWVKTAVKGAGRGGR